MYESLIGFFMTGTGNSFRVASWCAEAAAERGLSKELVQVKVSEGSRPFPPNSLSVFSYPTHGFTAPWLLMKFIWHLPRGEKGHAVVLPTRAGIRVKGVFVPGLEGTAGYLIAFLLWLRGYSVQGIMGVDMPSNWTALHWGMNEENASVITNMAESKVKSMMHNVLSGKKHYDGVVQFTIGLVLAKISFMYLIIAQLVLAKLFFASDKCNGCALCQSICPKKALRMVGTPKRPFWTYACDSCMACMNFCPQYAIEASPLVAILFYYVISVPVIAYTMRFAAERLDLQLGTIPLLGFGIQYGYTLLAVAASYWLLHFAFGSRLIRTVAAILSPTRYFRRYKAIGVSLKDIHRK